MKGQLLKNIRYIVGISQSELAEYLQITQPAVAQMELGRKAVPKRIQDKLEMLIEDLGTSQEELMFLSEIKKRGKGYRATIQTD